MKRDIGKGVCMGGDTHKVIAVFKGCLNLPNGHTPTKTVLPK